MKKKIQLRIALLLTFVFIFLAVIIPGVGDRTYYIDKIDTLKGQTNNLKKYALHQKYHEARFKNIVKQSEQLKQQWLGINEKKIQRLLRKLQRASNLETLSQNVSNDKGSGFWRNIIVQEKLRGDYTSVVKYLNLLNNDQIPMLVSNLNIDTDKPDQTNPKLNIHLVLKIYTYENN